MNTQTFYIESPFKGELQEICDLFKTYNSSASPLTSLEYLDWQYNENPEGKAIIACARDNESHLLAGIYLVCPVYLWLENKRVLSALSLNTYVHPDYRRQGMFAMLAKECYLEAKELGVEVIIGFPNEASYNGFVKKLDFKKIGNVTYLFKPLSMLNVFKELILKKRGVINFSDTVVNSELKLWREEELSDLDDFFDLHRETVANQIFRSGQYYLWRYFNKPSYQYFILSTKDSGNRPTALIVCRAIDVGRTTDLLIMDFCAIDENSAGKLIRLLHKTFEKSVTFSRVYAQPDTIVFKALKRKGYLKKELFTRKKSALPFIFRSLTKKQFELDFDKWNICLGDTDVV